MRVISYNPTDGSLISDPTTGLTFGNISLGQHCAVPALIQVGKSSETNILAMKLFLQSDGGLTGAAFGYNLGTTFYPGINYQGAIVGGATGGVTGGTYVGVTGAVISGMTGTFPAGVTGGITGSAGPTGPYGLTGGTPYGSTGGTPTGYTGGTPYGSTGGTYLGLTGGVTGGIFNHFTTAPGATGWPVDSTDLPHGVDIGITGGIPNDYIWLDVQLGSSGPVGPAVFNYRFCYDYN